jgi:prevent-host-death family protein
MRVANLAEVKNDLSRVVAQVRRGARVRILVRGVPAADLVPVDTPGNAGDESLAELERLGLVRRGAELSPRELAELDRPGPRVRGGRAVDALIRERRGGR